MINECSKLSAVKILELLCKNVILPSRVRFVCDSSSWIVTISLSLYISALLYINPWLKSQIPNQIPKSKILIQKRRFPILAQYERASVQNLSRFRMRTRSWREINVWTLKAHLECEWTLTDWHLCHLLGWLNASISRGLSVPFLLKGCKINLGKAFCDLCRLCRNDLCNV